MNGEYRIGDTVLGNWTLVRLLGEGAYGKVYEAHREDYKKTYTAAIKIMTIPQTQSEVESARAEGMDEESIVNYFDGFVGSVVNEFALMSELKGTANIVSYEDHSVVRHENDIGWDILIRMELLTPMLKYMGSHKMTRSDVIKLGIDMCKALEMCQRYNIIHRDIKPENIFISKMGDYKLGDFGVARTLEKTTGGLSKKGTYTYMAPEVYKDEEYGSTVDIYSLGIVLYRLLNNNRAPFLPAPPQPISYSERERALVRRISGEALPAPANAEGRLAEIVLKACAFNPKERYSSPLLMRQELEAIQYERKDDELIYGGSKQIYVDKSLYTTNGASSCENNTEAEQGDSSVTDNDKTVVEHKEHIADVFDDKTLVENSDASTDNTAREAAGDVTLLRRRHEQELKEEASDNSSEANAEKIETDNTAFDNAEEIQRDADINSNRKKNRKPLIIGICAAAAVLAGVILLWNPNMAAPNNTYQDNSSNTVSDGWQDNSRQSEINNTQPNGNNNQSGSAQIDEQSQVSERSSSIGRDWYSADKYFFVNGVEQAVFLDDDGNTVRLILRSMGSSEICADYRFRWDGEQIKEIIRCDMGGNELIKHEYYYENDVLYCDFIRTDYKVIYADYHNDSWSDNVEVLSDINGCKTVLNDEKRTREIFIRDDSEIMVENLGLYRDGNNFRLVIADDSGNDIVDCCFNLGTIPGMVGGTLWEFGPFVSSERNVFGNDYLYVTFDKNWNEL